MPEDMPDRMAWWGSREIKYFMSLEANMLKWFSHVFSRGNQYCALRTFFWPVCSEKLKMLRSVFPPGLQELKLDLRPMPNATCQLVSSVSDVCLDSDGLQRDTPKQTHSITFTVKSSMLCHALPCFAMLCHALPCFAMLCHALPCFAMLCAHPTFLDREVELRNEDIIALAAGLPRDLEEPFYPFSFLQLVFTKLYMSLHIRTASHATIRYGGALRFCQDLTLHLSGNEELNDDGVEEPSD